MITSPSCVRWDDSRALLPELTAWRDSVHATLDLQQPGAAEWLDTPATFWACFNKHMLKQLLQPASLQLLEPHEQYGLDWPPPTEQCLMLRREEVVVQPHGLTLVPHHDRELAKAAEESEDHGGSSCYMLLLKGKGKRDRVGALYVHRLVLWALAGPPPGRRWEAYEVVHLCLNRGCIHPDHLHWGTSEQNKAGKQHRREEWRSSSAFRELVSQRVELIKKCPKEWPGDAEAAAVPPQPRHNRTKADEELIAAMMGGMTLGTRSSRGGGSGGGVVQEECKEREKRATRSRRPS